MRNCGQSLRKSGTSWNKKERKRNIGRNGVRKQVGNGVRDVEEEANTRKMHQTTILVK